MLSGAIFQDQLGILREHYPDPYARALARLSPLDRQTLDSVTSVGWYSAALAQRVKDAVATEAGMSSLDMQRRVVHLSMERILKGIWRVFLRFLSDEGLVKRTPILYSKTFDRGAMTARWVSPGHLSAEICGWPGMPEYDIVGIATGIEVVFELLGRSVPRIDWKTSPDGASFDIRVSG